MQLDDYGFVMTDNGVMLDQGSWIIHASIRVFNFVLVMGMYSKTGGKNGKHADITESSSISAVSYMALEIFRFNVGRQFHPVSDATSRFHTVQFALLPSTSFLCLVDSKPKFKTPQLEPVELLPADFERFRSLKNGADKLQSAMKLFKKRTSGGNSGAQEE